MAKSVTIQTVVTQSAVQAAMVAVIMMREADEGTIPGTNITNVGQASIFQLECSRYIYRIHSFEIEGKNKLQTMTYELNETRKVPIINSEKEAF